MNEQKDVVTQDKLEECKLTFEANGDEFVRFVYTKDAALIWERIQNALSIVTEPKPRRTRRTRQEIEAQQQEPVLSR